MGQPTEATTVDTAPTDMPSYVQPPRSTGTAFYVQIAEQLRNAVRSGELEPLEQLPSEAALADMFRVSRMTVRQAVGSLVDEGLLYRLHGVGTFVSRRKLSREFLTLQSLYEQTSERGHDIRSETLDSSMVESTADTASLLEIEVDAPVARVRRLRTVDSEPLAVQVHLVPPPLGETLMAETGGHFESLYSFLVSHGAVIGRGLQTVEAVSANAELAGLLQVEPGSPVLYIETRTLSIDNSVLELSYSYYRGDRYSLSVQVDR